MIKLVIPFAFAMSLIAGCGTTIVGPATFESHPNNAIECEARFEARTTERDSEVLEWNVSGIPSGWYHAGLAFRRDSWPEGVSDRLASTRFDIGSGDTFERVALGSLDGISMYGGQALMWSKHECRVMRQQTTITVRGVPGGTTVMPVLVKHNRIWHP